MQPDEPGLPAPPTPASGNNYDFILSPSQQAGRARGGGLGSNQFILKLVFLIGGAILLMIVGTVLVNLLVGHRTNVDDLVKIAQAQTEISRLARMGPQTADQQTRYASINTVLTETTHSHQLVAYMKKHGRGVKDAELRATASKTTDTTLKKAKSNSTFDDVYRQTLRQQLLDVMQSIKTAHNSAVSQTEKTLLSMQYTQTYTILNQWPK